MIEPERIKKIEEQITLAGLLPGVNLDHVPPEESEKLKRALLDLYRLSHARGFKAGAEHTMNSIAGRLEPQPDASKTQLVMRGLSSRMREDWRELKKLLRSIRAKVIKGPRRRRFPTEALSGNWTIRR
jgi:hypothetical protein